MTFRVGPMHLVFSRSNTSLTSGVPALPSLLGLLILSVGLGVIWPNTTSAQTHPAPTVQAREPETTDRYTIYETPGFTRAVQNGTRTRTGRPGPNYWQQFARYQIQAQLHPARHRLVGKETITYFNHSPDTLRRVAVHLRQNLFAPDVARQQRVPVTGGVSLQRVAANGHPLLRSAPDSVAGYNVDGTVAWLRLPTPLVPDDSVHLSFEWSHTVPPSPADGKEGRDDGVYFLGYWYPQVAVYDDVDGWVAEQYTGQAEFYMGQADYDVRLTVPQHWLVGATGELQNPDDVLSPRSRRRLRRARQTGQVVSILETGERGTGIATTADGPTATWHFRADSVRDFAWGTSDEYLWDATRALVPPSSGQFSSDGARRPRTSSGPAQSAPDTVLIHSFYRPTEAAAAWPVGGARYTKEAVESLSQVLPPYPYASMTSMEGVLRGGGMEYPMVTIMQPWADTLKLAGDLMHEVGHMWIPMEVGTNEKRHVWMDEGTTQFNTAQGLQQNYGPGPRPAGRANDSESGQRRQYLEVAQQDAEVPLMRHGDRIPYGVYYDLPYDKGAQVMAALRGVLGQETFWRAYRTFMDRWWGKHPQPYDFFNTVNDVTDRDLSWFWHTWFYTTWTLDQAITSVDIEGDSMTITVTNLGQAPMPTPIVITREDGTTEQRRIAPDVWLNQDSHHTLHVSGAPSVVRVEIDPKEKYPDVDRSNQVWTP